MALPLLSKAQLPVLGSNCFVTNYHFAASMLRKSWEGLKFLLESPSFPRTRKLMFVTLNQICFFRWSIALRPLKMFEVNIAELFLHKLLLGQPLFDSHQYKPKFASENPFHANFLYYNYSKHRSTPLIY